MGRTLHYKIKPKNGKFSKKELEKLYNVGKVYQERCKWTCETFSILPYDIYPNWDINNKKGCEAGWNRLESRWNEIAQTSKHPNDIARQLVKEKIACFHSEHDKPEYGFGGFTKTGGNELNSLQTVLGLLAASRVVKNAEITLHDEGKLLICGIIEISNGKARPNYGEIQQQIGYLQGYNEYINSLKEVWRGCYHTLHKGCRLCINIGDQFTRTEDYGKHIAFPNHADIIRSCIDLNFDYLGSIIWQKLATCNTSGGASVLGSYPYPPNGLVSYNYEHILIFKKPGERPKVDEKIKESSKLSKNDWFNFFNSPWKFAGKKQNGHIAQFPKELPQRLIKMFSFIGDIVLDPFVGSGTTCIASIENRRKSIGIELNSKYIKLIEKNIQKTINTAGKHWRWEQLA